MKNRQFVLSESAGNELQGAYHNCADAQTKMRLQAVRLYGQGRAVNEIERLAEITANLAQDRPTLGLLTILYDRHRPT